MAVRIRLRRVGKKKMPVYHIVAADSRAARNGKFLEIVGRYDPLQHPMVITLQEQRLFHWLKCGALPTDTVRSLLQRSGLWLKWSLVKKGKDEAAITAEMERWQMGRAEKQRHDDERRQRRAAARRKAKKTTESESAPAPAATATEAAPAA